ncbi:unnamed protein product [Parnassius mnemosyne]|uniref:Uncharacterized protein n=1 Tax=Parnassius mnemosyne TaxID=213953 RepID=A0AAV1L2X4_9NEOP
MQTLLISKINISHIVAYTDSSTVLAWINTESYKLKRFVAHRVVKITDAFEPCTWRHVPTQDNPADFPSRGLSCAELVNCTRWWSGPDWMLSGPDHWPAQSQCELQDDLPELRTRTLIAQSRESDKDIMKVLLNRYSSLSRLQRVLAWVFRFIPNSRNEQSQREKGAKRYLEEMVKLLIDKKQDISDQLTSRGISWKLNPPSAPHFGGIFESGIKCTKYYLKRVIGSQVLTFEELTTVLTKVEAMLNSRPICQLSSDPGEVDVLTAGHFIIGRPLVALPEPSVEDMNPRTRWQLLQKLSQIF